MRRPALAGLDLLSTSVVLVDASGHIVFANLSAEHALGASRKSLGGQPLAIHFSDSETFERLLRDAVADPYTERRTMLQLPRPGANGAIFDASIVAADAPPARLLIELRVVDERVRQEREERLREVAQTTRELVRNMAHEIKNPLGGIRGAAQLLSSELATPALREYTSVIIKEADRLQTLVDRLLAPHRVPHLVGDVNVHEVCERVRSVLRAEYGPALVIERDYDASLPEFRGDKEQLIQAVMNLVRNAAQALDGQGHILLKTRVARQVTIHRERFRLALDLHVIDDGPGIPEDIRERIFLPLVSGREGGSGLGLTLAQTFVSQHGGTIECDSRPGRTEFIVRIPLP